MAGLGKIIIPAVKGRMGDRDYFSAVMRMQDIAARVEHASKIELSDEYLAATEMSGVPVPELDPSDRLQRDEKQKRLESIVEYLRRDDRFFNSLVIAVVGEPKWRHFKDSSLPPLKDYAKVLGFLELSGKEKMYALDGQHRLSGVKLFLEQGNTFPADEAVGVVFVEHQADTPEGKMRSRDLFTVLNKEVVAVSKKDIIYLDEKSAMAITTRALIEDEKGIFSLSRKRVYAAPGNTLPRSEKRCFTTVGALYDCLGTLFAKAFYRGKSKKVLESKRLSDGELKYLRKNTEEFFKMLSDNVLQVKHYFSARTQEEAVDIVSRWRNEKKGGHVLFRPAGLKVFVEVVCAFYEQGRVKGEAYAPEEMRRAIEKATRLPLRLNQAPSLNIVWDDAQKVIVPKQFPLLGKVYKHMLRLPQKKEDEIELQYQNALGNPKAKLPQLKG